MSSPNKTMNSGANNTFYNLQNKRTLPRQVLKWMQGLDLSYSVKDYRKDMSNGFLIGEIISRYQPGRIPMHAFQNTQNAARRQNNWNQLNLFFRKHNIRDISIGTQQYSSIMKEKDSKSEQLYQLICRLYTICTKRSITENAPIVDVPPTQVNNPNLTASYLLKEEGLQKLDNNSGTLGISRNKTHNIDNSKVDEKSPDRVPTRKIAPNIDANSNMVDVTGIGIKAENRKMTKRKTWQANKEQTNYEDQNQDSQKLIFDYLNQIIEECIPTNDYNLRDLLLPENPKYNLTQSVKKLVPNLDKEFFCNFLHQISVNIDKLIPIMLRQINQIWKFFSYFIKMMRTYSEDSQQFAQLFEIVQNYAINCYIKQSKRLQKVFNESLIQLLIIEVKTAKQWKKRQALMGLVYDFQGRQLHQKKIVLNKLKQILGSNNSLYIEWLAILIRQQTKNKANLDNKLIQDFIYYAHQYLSSANQILRTSSLKILQEISKTDSIQLIKEHFISKGKSYQTSQADPQQVMLLIIIYINLLKNLINSKDYQNLIKGGNTNNLVKAYNPDNQKNMEDLKKKLQLLSETIYKLFSSTSDNVVKEITSKLIVELIPQHQLMMQIFLDFFLIIQEKEEFMQSQQATYELKSFRITCPKIQASILEDFSNQILIKIINNMLKNDTKIENYLYLINYSLEHINIKKVNMQIWEDIAIHIVKPYTELLANYKHTTLALKGIQIICLIIFNYDMKIRELNGWLAKIFIRITQDNNSGCRPKIIAFNQFLNEQYAKTKHEPIRFMAQELSQILQNKGITNIIVLKE